MLVEIGDSAETLLDARATRRLVALELSEIEVPAKAGKAGYAPLFFRVVQVEHDVRVELWQRGEYHGARVIAGSNAAGQLGARRVALAAAELARRLQRKRQVQAERELAQAKARAAAAALEARRALEGPLAVRPSLAVVDVGAMSSTLVGPRLLGQWTFTRRGRIDGGFAWLAGDAPGSARLQWLELSLAPMQRVSLSDAVELDLGVSVAASLVSLTRARAVDTITDQHETWSARAAAVARLEPRLSRQWRLSVGLDAGLMLRRVPYQTLAGSDEHLRGVWLGLDLGVVYTPR